MAATKKTETPEERKMELEAYDRLLEEALAEPIKFLKHDNMSHADEKLSRLVAKHGMAWFGRYWLLAELLAGRADHSYDVSDAYGWRRLAHDMSCLCEMSVDECKAFIMELDAFGLVCHDNLTELNKVVITRVRVDAYAYAETVATKRFGAWKTNRKRMLG